MARVKRPKMKASQQAVVRAPDDISLRLRYAARLLKRGDPRGEFIRVQCELDAAERGTTVGVDLSYPELKRREAALLSDHGADWAGPVRDLVVSWTFFRGFVEHVTMEALGFEERGARVFEAAPVRHLDFRNARRRVPELAGSSLLRRCRSLGFAENDLDDQDLIVLAASPHLRRLRWLDLSENRRLTVRGMEALAAASRSRLSGLRVVLMVGVLASPLYPPEYDHDGTLVASGPNPVGQKLERKYGKIRWLHPRLSQGAAHRDTERYRT